MQTEMSKPSVVRMPRAVYYRLLSSVRPWEVRGLVMDYVLAANGLFCRARRRGLEALVPVAECEVRGGLAQATPYLKLDTPRLDRAIIERIFELSRAAKMPVTVAPEAEGGNVGETAAAVTVATEDEGDNAVEMLFHLWWDEEAAQWHLEVPAQEQRVASVRPLDDGVGSSYERALVEIHSHHNFHARFSATDDADERVGFRIYGVIGRIFEEQPQIRFRVGLHGHLWEVAANEVVEELPEGVRDMAYQYNTHVLPELAVGSPLLEEVVALEVKDDPDYLGLM